MQSLPISRLIAVSVVLTPSAASAQNLSTLLVLGSSPIIDATERYRDYGSLAAVAAEFSSTMPEYKAAALWFGQSPSPRNLKIGRWAKTPASGSLRGATLSAAGQTLSNWTAVTTGSFSIIRDGAAAVNVTGLNLSGATSLNNVASIISVSLTGATMVWNASFQRFEITSASAGANSSIAFLTPAGSGTDISALLGMQAAQGGYSAQGAAAESALQAATLFDSSFGQSWYALVIPEGTDADHLAVAGYIEATNTKHVYGVTTMDASVLTSVGTSDIAYALKQLAYKKTLVQYSSSNGYVVASALSRILSVDYTGSNTAITLMYKQEPGVVPEQLNSTQALALEAKRCNVFVGYDNNTSILQRGVMSSGNFVDEITGTDWLAVTLQAALYNVLYTSTTKIPQTDAGTQLLTTTCESVCSQAVTNGLLAPGVWNSGGFGVLKQGDYMPKAFYVYAPRVGSQNPSDRAARKSVPIQVAAKLAGAVHDISVAVTVNQ